jgi:hypothetical protein
MTIQAGKAPMEASVSDSVVMMQQGEGGASCSRDGEASKEPGDEARRPLSEDNADTLALMTGRINETAILRHMRATAARKLVLAMPIDPGRAHTEDMLDIMLGMVVHCEAISEATLGQGCAGSGGWAVGTVVAPGRLAGQRGCFRREGMVPMLVELAQARMGEPLLWAKGGWEQVDSVQEAAAASPAQARLRRRALVKRLQAARLKWEQEKCGHGART